MDNHDRELILGLANRLRQAHPAPKDPQAAELIAQYIASQPDSLYLLVQAVLLQEDALRTAQERMGDTHTGPPVSSFGPAPAPAGGGGFMSRMFGQGRDTHPMEDHQRGRSGGGFLKTAGAAAAGVAGGALLFQGLNEVFGSDQAPAGEAQGAKEEQDGWNLGDLF